MFAELACTLRRRERPLEITARTLVVHDTTDAFFPVGNAEALARENRSATLRVLVGS
jgi:pimeloyl-ACP methyl ester carboxylesterase